MFEKTAQIRLHPYAFYAIITRQTAHAANARPHGQAVKTSPSHGGIWGSIPHEGTKKGSKSCFFSLPHRGTKKGSKSCFFIYLDRGTKKGSRSCFFYLPRQGYQKGSRGCFFIYLDRGTKKGSRGCFFIYLDCEKRAGNVCIRKCRGRYLHKKTPRRYRNAEATCS